MFLFNFLGQSGIWKVSCDRFILHEITTYGIKRGTLSGLLVACQQVIATFGLRVFLISIDYFFSCHRNEEIVESSGRNNDDDDDFGGLGGLGDTGRYPLRITDFR